MHSLLYFPQNVIPHSVSFVNIHKLVCRFGSLHRVSSIAGFMVILAQNNIDLGGDRVGGRGMYRCAMHHHWQQSAFNAIRPHKSQTTPHMALSVAAAAAMVDGCWRPNTSIR